MTVRADSDYSPGWWSFGLELYRHPAMFSRGSGPEYGGYLWIGPWRGHLALVRPIRRP